MERCGICMAYCMAWLGAMCTQHHGAGVHTGVHAGCIHGGGTVCLQHQHCMLLCCTGLVNIFYIVSTGPR